MTRSRERLIGVAAVAVVLVAGALLLIRPVRDATAQARDDERAARRESQSLQDQIRALEPLQAREAVLRKQAADARAEFPPSPALPDLVAALQELADRAGVELASVAPDTPKPSTLHPELAEITTGVNVVGGYFEIQDFLVRLEDLVKGVGGRIAPRSLLVTSVAIVPGGGSGSVTATSADASTPPDELTATISLSAFQATRSPAATPAAGP